MEEQSKNLLVETSTNRRLPFNPTSKNDDFPPDVDYNEFCKEQWTFCAPYFTGKTIPDIVPLRLLPISKITDLNQGGTAKLYEIEVHGCYHDFHGSHHKTQEERHHFNSTSSKKSNTFVLKTFTADTKAEYESEVETYSQLSIARKYRHIINFYGHYTYKNTYNIIMELADQGSLEQYFKNHAPPVESADITKFWANLFGICLALHSIHTIELNKRELAWSKGWHQDVKPDNILVFSNQAASPYEYTFKLADFGLCHFKQITGAGYPGTAVDARGTSRYGAPECFRLGPSGYMHEAPLYVDQNVDIWSFGCVLSEAAVWLSNNYTALIQYRAERRIDTDPNLGDCFHDSEKVSRTVLDWHQKVRDTLRLSDNITTRVLTVAEEWMLLQDPDLRLNAIQIWKKLHPFLSPKTTQIDMAAPFPFLSRSRNSQEIPSQSTEQISQPYNVIQTRSLPSTFRNYLDNKSVSGPENYGRVHSHTHSYLNVQQRSINELEENMKNRKNNISAIHKLISTIAEAEEILKRDAPKEAYEKLREARELKNIITHESSVELEALGREQDCVIWTGMANAQLRMAEKSTGRRKEEYMENAQSYAHRVQLVWEPKGKESDALEFLMRRSKMERSPGVTQLTDTPY